MVGAVYTFGFILMCPQLYLNYKLKSVAHLPWRMMTYKALNTFIDDLFAFIIKMPTLHRLSSFRDDIIFFIFLYQRWIYPTDKTRVNEFGISGTNIDKAYGLVGTTPSDSKQTQPCPQNADSHQDVIALQTQGISSELRSMGKDSGTIASIHPLDLSGNENGHQHLQPDDEADDEIHQQKSKDANFAEKNVLRSRIKHK
jgi:hypothetical protein